MKDLEQTCEVLTTKLSQAYQTDQEEVVKNYFDARRSDSKRNQLEYGVEVLDNMEGTIVESFLPVYNEYMRDSAEIQERLTTRKPLKYVGIAVAIGEALELLVFKTATLRPQILGISLILESAVGLAAYQISTGYDIDKLKAKQKRLTDSIADLNTVFVNDYTKHVEAKMYDSPSQTTETSEPNIPIDTAVTA